MDSLVVDIFWLFFFSVLCDLMGMQREERERSFREVSLSLGLVWSPVSVSEREHYACMSSCA